MDIGNLGFHQENIDGYIIRTFPQDIEDDLLYWHKDAADRLLLVIEGEGWKIQMDNALPVKLIHGVVYPIPKETFHRIIKGSSDLIVKIKEL